MSGEITPFCKKCNTTDATKFTSKKLDLCVTCKNYKIPKIYQCKNCGDKDEENFYTGRYSTCKKCRNNKGNDLHKEKSLEDVTINKEFQKAINKYIINDKNIFIEYSIKEKIEDVNRRLIQLEIDNEFLKEENQMLKSEINKIKMKIDFDEKNYILK